MIPTMILAGVLAGFLPGRWPLAGVVIAALLWPVALLFDGGGFDGDASIGAALLGLLNAAAGAVTIGILKRAARLVGSA